MDSDPPPRSPQLSPKRSSVAAFGTRPQPDSDHRWAGQRPAEQSPMAQQGLGEAAASPATPGAPSTDSQDLLARGSGDQPAGPPGPGHEGSGLGLAAPLIGALIGLLTLVVPMVVVLDDRPGHPLAKPPSLHTPAQVSPGSP